jgi:hypothetical protein
VSDFVGRARMQTSANGESHPSVSTAQLETTSVSPDARRCRDRGPHVVVRRAVEVLGRNAVGEERLDDGLRVVDADGEDDGALAVGVLMPALDDAADDLLPVHGELELALDVVAAARAHVVRSGRA